MIFDYFKTAQPAETFSKSVKQRWSKGQMAFALALFH